MFFRLASNNLTAIAIRYLLPYQTKCGQIFFFQSFTKAYDNLITCNIVLHCEVFVSNLNDVLNILANRPIGKVSYYGRLTGNSSKNDQKKSQKRTFIISLC